VSLARDPSLHLSQLCVEGGVVDRCIRKHLKLVFQDGPAHHIANVSTRDPAVNGVIDGVEDCRDFWSHLEGVASLSVGAASLDLCRDVGGDTARADEGDAVVVAVAEQEPDCREAALRVNPVRAKSPDPRLDR